MCFWPEAIIFVLKIFQTVPVTGTVFIFNCEEILTIKQVYITKCL